MPTTTILKHPASGLARVLCLGLTLALSACGDSGSASSGDGGSGQPPPAPTISKAEAFQFLNQATFGATEAEAAQLQESGYQAWIEEQLTAPASLQLPFIEAQPPVQFPFELQEDRVDIWFRHAINAPDQLRQRVAFALSEIMVVSQLGALNNAPWALADYYDMLARNAFGNFRTLMEDVTLHPAMGVYLSMLGNQKPNPALNIRPDENYARELMQLFTIGLVELDPDGTVRRDARGEPIPTYDQSIIEGFAHVFTGWHFAGAPSFELARPTRQNQTQPMQLYPDFHDTGPKKLLRGVTLPAGQSGEQDLDAALDNIFAHPNVGPFIAMRLIERLVTSNPSPGYVERVAATFDDNGSGVRGDLAAVVQAILLDPEARPGLRMDTDGKLKEPLLRVTQLWRAYDGAAASGSYAIPGAYIIFGQGPLQSPSVFNFFSPSYAPPGEIKDRGLVAPELEIATEYQNTLMTNLFAFYTFVLNQQNPDLRDDQIAIDLADEIALAGDPEALIDLVDGKLLGGAMSTTLRGEIESMLARIPESEALARAAEAVYLTATSPEYAYQK